MMDIQIPDKFIKEQILCITQELLNQCRWQY